MYKPAARTDGRNLEFIELYNSNPWAEDVSGYRLAGQVDYVIPAATAMPAQGYLVVAANPADMRAVYGLTNVLGPYSGGLKTSGSVKLHDEQDSVLLAVDYDSITPWPMGADGTGHSIVLARPSYGEGDPRAWERSELAGGSPGAAEVVQTSALRNVVINEVLAHTDPPAVDFIELYNHNFWNAVDVSGCTLSDDPTTNKFTIPEGTWIPSWPFGFLVFTEDQLGFRLNAAGETVYFRNRAGTQMLDAIRFEAQENGVSFGRYPDGANDWYRLSTPTPEDNNAAPVVSPVGFNEIMYHPPSAGDDGQYVELYNNSTHPVALGGWKVGGGISYEFPSNCVLAARGYLVVGRNTTWLLTNYPQLNATNTYGNFSGRLSGRGERLTLTVPDTIVGTNSSGALVTNQIDIVVDDVTYGTGGRWGRWSDGGGSSLELIDPRSNKRLAANWADSDETAKAPWTTIVKTGVLDNGSGAFSPMQIGLLGAGECLVDNVEVLNSGGVNCVGNANFEQGTNYVAFIGNHSRSSLETNSGFGGSVALHLRTADAIATTPNYVQLTLTNNTFAAGQTATLRFKARWLRGCPEPLLRFWGCYLEATGGLSVPANLGTPGLPNSQAKTNNGPAIFQVRHDPAVPASSQPVVVSARVSDPDGVASVTLRYRLDPDTATTDIPMNDAGYDGDTVAGDGIYSATLPGRTTNAIAFVVWATDNSGASSCFPELVADNAPARECVVFFGEPKPGNLFGTYHLWLSQTNVARWKQLPIMSNEEIDGTLVYNNRVIYNMGGCYSGSVWHQNYDGPAGNKACHYVWSMPKDDLLLGYSSFNKIQWPGNDIQNDTITSIQNDVTLQREQAATLFLRCLGVPWMNHRFVAVYVNGIRRGKLMEDACRPTAGEFQDEYCSDDSDGQYYKIQRWYDGSSTTLISECLLQQYLTTGNAQKPARYRPNWALKTTSGSLSDFTNLYTLITAATAYNQPNYADLLDNVVDGENWMRLSAAQHAAGNWDGFGSTSGQNVDAWISAHHRWPLFLIDFGICLDNNISGVGLFSMSDPAWSQMLAKPKFGRMYYRALNELVGGAMQASYINPILDAKYAAMTAAGYAPAAPTATKTWIANQRSSIISQLASVNAATFSLSGTSFLVSNNSVTLAGSAPVEAVDIRVNGVDYCPTWTSLTTWNLVLPVSAGAFNWTVEARNRQGGLIGVTNSVTVMNTGTPDSPAGSVIFSEIMYNATAPGAEYIELFNRSTNTAFDLSGWEVNGIGYTFPAGSVLQPQQYLVLASSSVVFASTYSALIPVFGTFDGNLQASGETLSLIKPGLAPAPDLVVDRVRYEPTPPWPTRPSQQPGTSLQLVDASRDNSRVANWAAGPALSCTPGGANSVAAPLPEFPPLWLNEVQAWNLTGPADNFGEHEPWVELYNAGTNSLSLAGYYLSDTYTNLGKWAFPANAAVSSNGFMVVWCDNQTNQSAGNSLHAGFKLLSGVGCVALSRLTNGTFQLVDYLNYTNLPANWSYGDVPDGQPFYRDRMFFATPGASNDVTMAPNMVFINEWMADNTHTLADPADNDYEDWFELYNPGTNTVALDGYYLTDNLTDRFQYQIPSNGHYVIPPHGFLLVWADNETGQNSTNRADLHVNFKLDKAGEAIGLFAADGTAIDAVTFGPQTSDVSEGRSTDGSASLCFMPTPTPRSSNISPNTAPVLDAMGDRYVHSGQTLHFTATATDAESAYQMLTYSLTNSPAGAAINPVTGAFSWPVVNAAVPSTNRVTVRVTDNGLPPLSDTRTFSVFVLPPPQFGEVAPDSSGHITLSFGSLNGQAYQVEYKDALTDPVWTTLGSPVSGTGGTLELVDDLPSQSQRFYRLVVLP